MKDKKTVAYFCMEFGLDDSFKIYSGGLGILAGDVLKGAKDIGYPMVGIGVLWRQGYTKQFIGEDDRLYDSYTDYKYDFLEDTGIMIDVMVRDCLVQIKVWKCERFGNVPLYLLDTFMGCNDDWYLTGQLYGWFGEERIAQELILGIGGVKALRALGIDVDTYHFNDSHPLFAVTELVKDHIAAGKSFDEACDIIREKIVFTTHTPVAAGNEEHEHRLVEYMGAYNGLTRKQMIKLGGDPFGMTVAGLRMSKKANGVAQLHGRTARKMWAHIEGGKDILSITNGVHCGTWWDKNIRDSYESKQDLWNPHMHLKRKMIGEIQKMNHVHLKEDVLTIGFARRVAPYKRSDLIFSNLEIIEPLLNEGKLQLVFSGKSHPN
ncbi:MAG: alpha-glucan family phosphorylase, partial [Clostridiales bacterium]|nr:alpha-glucan family phosphorylase [Clostridiales bacterium]